MTMIRGRYVRPFPVGSAPGPVAALAEAYRDLLTMPDQAGERAAALARDQNLTAVGRKAALRAWAHEGPVAALTKGRAALQAGDRAIAEIRARMNTTAVDKGDFAGAVLRSDIRAWIRGMSPPERTAMLAVGDYNPNITAALLEAPPELSGLSPEQHATLSSREVIARNPAEAAEIAKIEEAMLAVVDADRATTITLETDAGIRPSEVNEALGGQTLSQRLAALLNEEPQHESDAA